MKLKTDRITIIYVCVCVCVRACVRACVCAAETFRHCGAQTCPSRSPGPSAGCTDATHRIVFVVIRRYNLFRRPASITYNIVFLFWRRREGLDRTGNTA